MKRAQIAQTNRLSKLSKCKKGGKGAGQKKGGKQTGIGDIQDTNGKRGVGTEGDRGLRTPGT